MNKEKLIEIKDVISSLRTPLIVENIYCDIFKNAITIDASSDIKNFTDTPMWLNEIEGKNYLIIKNIDYISKEDQLKLVDILKYHKVGTNKIYNTVVVLTVDKMDLNYINDEIISLTVQI